MGSNKFFGNWIVKNILLAIGAFLALAVVTNILLGVITHHGQEIEVPDFTNMKVSDAKYNAGVAGMRIEVIDSVYVRRMGRGLVYSQNPKAGSKVKKGRRILLTINSIIPKKVQMPNLVGFSMRQAKAELLSRGLNLGKLIYVEDMATNNVLRQLRHNREIRPGRMIESGSDIDLVVGLSGDDNRTFIPNVVGMKYMHAIDVVHDNSLNIGRLVFDDTVKSYGDTLDAVVYKQGPGASRAPTLMGSDVSLYLTLDTNRVPSR